MFHSSLYSSISSACACRRGRPVTSLTASNEQRTATENMLIDLGRSRQLHGGLYYTTSTGIEGVHEPHRIATFCVKDECFTSSMRPIQLVFPANPLSLSGGYKPISIVVAYLRSYLRRDVVSMLICSVEESDDLVQGGVLQRKHMLGHLEQKERGEGPIQTLSTAR